MPRDESNILPRVLRYRDAPAYLGMDRSVFDVEVRPYIAEVPIGRQGVGFDRLDLDAWWEQHKASRGRPAKQKEKTPWPSRQRRGSGKEAGFTTSTSASRDSQAGDFERALAQLTK
jgi:predicted DNA-binding transcriptional regulator AlpA